MPLPPLQFLGFTAGAPLEAVDSLYRARAGRRLTCRQAQRDPAVRECRGAFPNDGATIHLWLSAMDGRTGILTLRARTEAERLARWRQELEEAYGRVAVRTQGAQSTMQWVRRGRMLRLTWRADSQGREASVSLVDGQVLDGWGRRSAPGGCGGGDSVACPRAKD